MGGGVVESCDQRLSVWGAGKEESGVVVGGGWGVVCAGLPTSTKKMREETEAQRKR